MLPSDSPLVDVALVFRTGAAEDPVGKKGVTALAAAMLSQAGTQSRSYEDIQRAMYPLAAPLNLQVDKDLVRIYGTVHRDNLQHWWAVVNEQITLPGLREEDFERLRGQQINNIRASLRANNDEELGKELLYERIYGPAHAYGTLTLGRVGDLQKLTIDDVRNALVSRFSRTRLIFGIAGGFDSAVADEMFASLVRLPRDDSRAPPVGPATPATQRGALIVRKETPAVAVSFGVPLSVKRGDPDWVALWLARSWLGEHRSTAGRLFDRIRELRGMNYGSYAYVEYFPNGMFRVMPEPNYARANDIFQIWIRPLRSNNDAVFATRTALYEVDQLVRKGLAPAEFERTRDFLRKFVSNLTSTQTAQLGYAIDSRVYGTAGFVDYVRKGLDELTVDKVNAAVRKHFDLRGAQFVFVAADADDLAKRLGSGAASPISYNTPKAADVQAEDKRIQALPLGLAPGRVSIVDEAKVFE
jgi:zinc protease